MRFFRSNAILLLLFFIQFPGVGRAKLLEIPDVSRDEVICFTLYTVHNNVLKMTAQLYPLVDGGAPLEAGKNREVGMPEYTGEFLDGFGNKITMLAVANPGERENHDKLTTRSAGFGVVKFNKKRREITILRIPA